jgi:hypothetical protein
VIQIRADVPTPAAAGEAVLSAIRQARDEAKSGIYYTVALLVPLPLRSLRVTRLELPRRAQAARARRCFLACLATYSRSARLMRV